MTIAPSKKSIWDRVGQRTFEDSIDLLHSTKFIPEPRVLREENWPEDGGTDFLPFAIERQLSDDIAFVSAYEYGVAFVTAAVVEARGTEGLLIRIAANEGVCTVVENAWKKLIPILEGCAKKGQWKAMAFG